MATTTADPTIAAGGALVTIVDNEGNHLQSVLAVSNGDVSVGKAELRFDKQNGQRSLVGISLPNSGLQIGGARVQATTLTRNKVKPAEAAAKKS